MTIWRIPMTSKPKVISLFSGCGGLDYGFHLAGYETVWANDINEWAVKTFERNFGKVINSKNIEDIDPLTDKSIPECDLIIGGFPCQDFSIIWKQPGLDGNRGNLYKNYLRFIDAKKPKAFVAENVKGLLTANDGRAIKQIIDDFSHIGPGYMVKVQLYNFAEYGVAQLRERVIIVGIRLDLGFNFQHPLPTHGPRVKKPYFTAGEALVGVENVPYNNEHQNIADKTRRLLEKIPEGGNFKDVPPDDPHYVKGMISHVYRRIHRNEPAKTIIAAGGGGTWGYHYPEPRPLTNRERARLQSFSDEFFFEGSITEVRRQIGNAVPPMGIYDLAKALLPLFHNNYKKVDIKIISEKLNKLTIKERLEYDFKNRDIVND
jgi:DNA (cytosine-5)-methyltransferase 1